VSNLSEEKRQQVIVLGRRGRCPDASKQRCISGARLSGVNYGPWKVWKTKSRSSTLPTVLENRCAIPTAAAGHRKVESQHQASHFPTALRFPFSTPTQKPYPEIFAVYTGLIHSNGKAGIRLTPINDSYRFGNISCGGNTIGTFNCRRSETIAGYFRPSGIPVRCSILCFSRPIVSKNDSGLNGFSSRSAGSWGTGGCMTTYTCTMLFKTPTRSVCRFGFVQVPTASVNG
jgi:hypothetical protein